MEPASNSSNSSFLPQLDGNISFDIESSTISSNKSVSELSINNRSNNILEPKSNISNSSFLPQLDGNISFDSESSTISSNKSVSELSISSQIAQSGNEVSIQTSKNYTNDSWYSQLDETNSEVGSKIPVITGNWDTV